MTTTVITRMYKDEEAARYMADKLRWEGFPRYALQVVSGTDADTASRRMKNAGVADDLSGGYASGVAGGQALLIVSATYKPLGAARIAREVIGGDSTIATGPMGEGSYKEGPDHAPSILKDHPRIMSLPMADIDYTPGRISDMIGWKMLKPHRTKRSAYSGTRHMSRAFWPMPLVSKGRNATSAMSGTRRMSRAFWPMPLLSEKARKNSVIRGGSLPFSSLFGWPPISSK